MFYCTLYSRKTTAKERNHRYTYGTMIKFNAESAFHPLYWTVYSATLSTHGLCTVIMHANNHSFHLGFEDSAKNTRHTVLQYCSHTQTGWLVG